MNLVLTQSPTDLYAGSGIETGTELIVQNIGSTLVSFSVTVDGNSRDYVAQPNQLVQVSASATRAFATAYQAGIQDASMVSVRSRAQFDMVKPFTGVDVGPAGPAGPTGATGPAGDGSTFPSTATQLTVIGNALRAAGASSCARADSSDIADAGLVIGIATNDAAVAETVQVRSAGYMTHAGWDWFAGEQIFVGVDGALTQVAPTTGFCQTVAVAVTSTTILVRINSPILVSSILS
jgi:hypothetical protein